MSYLPSNWKIFPLGELCRIEIGKTPARKNPKYWDIKKINNNVWLSIADLKQASQKTISDSKEYISNEGAAIGKIVEKGTLLVSFKLTLGRLAFTGRDLYTNEAIAALTPIKMNQYLNDYLYWYLTFFDWNKAAEGEEKVKGKTLNKTKLKLLDIVLPSLPEQKRIVAILDQAFQEIDQTIANTEKNLTNAKEIFESYLNDVFTKKGEGLEEKKLGELFDIGSSKRVLKSDWKLQGVPFYRAREIKKLSLYGEVDNQLFISEEMFSQYSRKYGSPKEGDLMVTAVGTIGICYAVKNTDRFYFKDASVLWFKNKNKIDSRFAEYAFKTNLIKKQINCQEGEGATVDTYTIGRAKNTIIMIPSLPEQKRIVKKLDELTKETQQLETLYQEKISALTELKQSILQKAFSGELTKDRAA